MCDSQKQCVHTTLIVTVLALAVLAFVALIVGYNLNSQRTYVENGYEQVAIPGAAGYLWQKPK